MIDCIVLGAGAAGLMAAAHLRNRSVLVIDHNPKAGAKIAVSGGGRCNVTNQKMRPQAYLGDQAFIEKVLGRFDHRALLSFLHRHGCVPIKRKGSQYFCPHRATELVDLLLSLCKEVDFRYNTEIIHAQKQAEGFVLKTTQGTFYGHTLLIATGGLSFKSLGASGIGFEIADSFGHAIVAPRPALVGLTLQKEQAWMKELAGISLPVAITVGRRKIEGDLLFTHRGISGPAVLDASLFWNQGKITVDFLPDVRLKSLFKHPSKRAKNAFSLPKRFVYAFFEALGLPNLPYQKMSESQKQRLSLLKSYAFAPAGTFGYTRAEVTKGGVSTQSIDPATMQSRLLEGLFFAGEVVDVTGRLGGYNFQWAFASAVVAADAIARKERGG